MEKAVAMYLLLLLCYSVRGQDSALVTKNFHFANGLYRSMAELQANRPAYSLEAVEIRSFTNPVTSLTQMERVVLKQSGEELDAGQFWALVLEGIPSVRVPRDEINKDLPSFAALKLRGKISYYTYPDWRRRKVSIAAYNPATGRPFRQGQVEREEEVIVEKMLHFETGEVVDFTLENFLRWISDDPVLLETFGELNPEEQHEKMFKGLLIYVDRNPTYLRN